MSQPDENMRQLFTDCTWLDLKEIDEILKTDNPRDSKMRLAFEITKIYHGDKAAKSAENNFIGIFQKKELPNEMRSYKLTDDTSDLIDVLVFTGLASSKK
ncbi:MAG: hypothetical protein H6759_02725 [Candidatus Nomurabacteria bacterium]|nr:MAG: hypothetical protein H6759_02725 [Candidatus Nomurabacteria bacterium]